MANKTGVKRGISNEKLLEQFKKSNYSFNAAAKALGCDTSNISRRLRKLAAAGELDPALLYNKPEMRSETAQEILNAQIELGLRNERKIRKGDWRKPSLIQRHGGPCILGLFGDPHLDNSGTDLGLFEDSITKLDPEQRIFGACVGDFFDNWPGIMGRLYKESGDPAPAWTLFKHWLTEHPFLFSVTGNHDQFTSGTADFLDEFFRERGMLLRRSGGRFLFDLGAGNPITISMRHIWPGNSMYSEAHNLKRAVTFGHTEDDLIAGGHIHKGELRTNIRPHDGKVSKLAQISSFKKLDNYANDRGFMSPETSPIVWCVLDDREPITSHSRVQTFYEFGAAKAMLEYQRGKNG